MEIKKRSSNNRNCQSVRFNPMRRRAGGCWGAARQRTQMRTRFLPFISNGTSSAEEICRMEYIVIDLGELFQNTKVGIIDQYGIDTAENELPKFLENGRSKFRSCVTTNHKLRRLTSQFSGRGPVWVRRRDEAAGGGCPPRRGSSGQHLFRIAVATPHGLIQTSQGWFQLLAAR